MTAKEKADELIDKMYYSGRYDDKENYIPAMAWERAKQCALKAVDEILEALKIDLDKDLSTIDVANFVSNKIIYWQEVKQEIVRQEIEKL